MLSLREIAPGGDISSAFVVREAVFVREQGVPPTHEWDACDPISYHVVLYRGGAPIACGRVYLEGAVAVLGRVAVLPAERRKGYATRVCTALVDVAARLGARRLTLHAQTYATPLYEKLGFARIGPEFLEEGIVHVQMDRLL
ncbi:MAG: GNAT family N-acetyltransferase [Oscillospiraceae bacterium]|jgi:predicted GNAT family N-acyltransferase|nr:GNAT family N-acetyltransferase [Oscillospiraceae bacterium]